MIKRYIIFFIGLFFSSFGVSIVTKADLGTSPISAVPYVLSLGIPKLSLGGYTVIYSTLLIIIQVILLRRNFKLKYLIQFPLSFVFGYFIDFTMMLISSINISFYVGKLLFLLLGCIVLAFGVYLQVMANISLLPGESVVRAFSTVLKKDFGIVKIFTDISMTVLAGLISLILLHNIVGVREGTIIAATVVGFICRLFNKYFTFIEKILFPELFPKNLTQNEICE